MHESKNFNHPEAKEFHQYQELKKMRKNRPATYAALQISISSLLLVFPSVSRILVQKFGEL
jgi:hypothetical protein